MVFGTYTIVACRQQADTMTSVTIPSSTGPFHGTSYPSVREELSNSESDFDSVKNSKRCINIPTTTDSCKKRRKQLMPIRIYNSETETCESIDVSIATTQPQNNSKLPLESEDVDLQCPVCQLKFELVDQLQNHIACEHRVSEFVKREHEQETTTNRTHTPSTSTSAFVESPLCLTMPRQDIQWTGELPTSKDWPNSNLQTIPPMSNPVFMAMSPFTQPENMQMKPIRIFNPDAFCDLCNKEFCNKYFLKTHKANKHGIYTDVTTESQLPNAVNIPSYTTNMNLKLPSSVPTVVDTSLNKNETKTTTIPTIPPTTTTTTATATATSATVTNLVNPYNLTYPCSFPTNKFPNKQNLPTTSTEITDTNENQISISGPITASDQPLSSSESEKVIPEEQQLEICSSPNNTQTESTSAKIECDGNMSFFDSLKMSPNQVSRELDLRLKGIGVMNPKAYCEICNKEYCNKYFLRTHKMKRHGIYIPDEKDAKYDAAGNIIWSPNIQTSPLNLIITEQSVIHDRKTTSPNDISCEICGIKFQNNSLAQLHNFTVHEKLIAKDFDNNLDMLNEDLKNTPSKMVLSDKPGVGNAEAISEDLQKLQTMILQLNELDVAKVSTICATCNKEFENRFYLHAHMVTEHGMLLDDGTDFEKSRDSENSDNNTFCDVCGKDLQNADEMKKHILDVHSSHSAVNDGDREDFEGELSSADKAANRLFLTGANMPERARQAVNVTPTSSYCEICNKELCNKYFMRTHMQRMHGIAIQNGAQIGGVVCDICNKELCSKYFLRVHKHNTHGIVEYGASLLQPRKSDGESFPPPPLSTSEPDSPLKTASDLADLSQRYFTHFTEVCPLCSRRFRSTKWLRAHLTNDHGQAGTEKWTELEQQLTNSNPKSTKIIKTERSSPNLKIASNGGPDIVTKKLGIQSVLSSIFGSDEVNAKPYQCSHCPFTSPLLPLLFIHERSHSINENPPIKCPVCPNSFLEKDLYHRHMYTQHPLFPMPLQYNGNSNKDTSQEIVEQRQQQVEEQSTTIQCNVKKEDDCITDQIKQQQSPVKTTKSKVTDQQMDAAANQSVVHDLVKKAQLPTTYAVPQQQIETTTTTTTTTGQEETFTGSPGYVMQAFLLEDSASERRVVPSVVYLPVIQKQPAPLTVTFNLTPA